MDHKEGLYRNENKQNVCKCVLANIKTDVKMCKIFKKNRHYGQTCQFYII